MKPLGSILQYMHDTKEEQLVAHSYEANDGYQVTHSGVHVDTLYMSLDGNELAIYSDQEGSRSIKYSDVENIEVFKLTKVA